MTERLDAEGRVDDHRAVALLKLWALVHRQYHKDYSQGVSEAVKSVMGPRAYGVPISPDPNVDPKEKMECFENTHYFPEFVEKVDDREGDWREGVLVVVVVVVVVVVEVVVVVK